MKYAVEMGSRVMIYIPSFVKIGSAVQKLMVGYTQTHNMGIAEAYLTSWS
jgi:hypothetical protein